MEDHYLENDDLIPVLLLANSDDDGDDDIDKDDGSSSLVIGTGLPLPTQSRLDLNLYGRQRPRTRESSTLQVAEEQYQKLRQRKIERVNKTSGKSTSNESASKDVRHGNNRLRRQAAELATQHPEYSDLSRELREGVRESVREGDDIDYKEHPNTSTRYDMRRFDVRMATFINNPLSWTLKIPSAEQLARVGLYYVGMEDRVCCFSCHIELEEWGEDEDPLLRHYMASPHCLFLHQDFSQQLKTLKQQLTTSTTHQSQGYSNTSRRLHSFAQWPYSHIVTSYQLASVGFYYTGEGTKVICFSCGLVVRDWKRGDVPLLVHCRTNPDCPFIKSIIKGAPSSEPSVPTPILKTLTTADSTATNRPNFNDIQIRLKSFKKLSPAFPVSRQQLAEAGLYLLRLPDVMKCFKCSCILQSWVEGDTAVEKHRGASPYCTFLAEKFPSKLSTSLPEVDPNDLPAPQYNEQQLEMMAKQQRPLSATLSTESQLPFHRLSISNVPLIPNTPSSSGYHTMSQLSTTELSSHASFCGSQPSTTEQSSYASFCGPTSLPSTVYSAKSYPTTPSSMPTPLTHTPEHTPLSSIAEHSLSLSSSTSSSTVSNKSVSLPPSYTHNMTSDPTQSTASALSHQQPSSLPAGAECVVCMDRPLEMVFVPCGHICVCEICSNQIVRCPICRTRTEMAVKVYYPY